MNFEYFTKPTNTTTKVTLFEGEGLIAEPGAMIAMDDHLNISTSTYQGASGGIMKGLKRMLSGESFFLNHYTLKSNLPGHIYLASTFPGDQTVIDVPSTHDWIVQGGSFIACENTLEVTFNFQGIKGLFSGEGLFWLKTKGVGKTLIGSFGQILEKEVDGEFIVDSGHIVAFEDSLQYSIDKVGSNWIESFLSGEGLVTRFRGKGKLLLQSHNPKSFGKGLSSYLSPIESNQD